MTRPRTQFDRVPAEVAAALALLAVAGCGAAGPSDGVATVQMRPVVVESLTPGVQLQADVLDASGALLSGVELWWGGGDPEVGVVSTSGFFTPIANGVTSVTARAPNGVTASVRLEVRQRVAAFTNLPETLRFDAVADTFPIRPGATDPGGSPIPDTEFVWTSSAPLIMTVIDERSVVSQGNGSALLRGVYGPFTFLVPLVVDQVPRGIRLELDSTSLGAIDHFTGPRVPPVIDRNGQPIPGEHFRFESSDSSIVVPGRGDTTVVGIANGTVTVRARFADWVSEELQLEVRQIPTEFRILSGAPWVGPGESTDIEVRARDATRRNVADYQASWTALNPDIATVDATGRVTGIREGPFGIQLDGEATGYLIPGTVAEPGAGWSEWEGWRTFQANPQRTGYVPVFSRIGGLHRDFVTPIRPGTPLLQAAATRLAIHVADIGGGGNPARNWAVSPYSGAVAFGVPGAGPAAVYDGRLYYVAESGDSLHARDASTGAPIWAAPLPPFIGRATSPALDEGGTLHLFGPQYFAFTLDGALLRQTGAPWRSRGRRGMVSVVGGDAYVYATGLHTFFLRIRPLDSDFVTVLTDPYVPPALPNNASRTVAITSEGDLVVTNDGRLIAYDVESAGLQWERKETYYGEVAIGDGEIYAFNGRSVDVVSESTGELLWSWPTRDGGIGIGPIVLTRNLVFVPTSERIYGIHRATRSVVWYNDTPAVVSIGPSQQLILARPDGYLEAYDMRPFSND